MPPGQIMARRTSFCFEYMSQLASYPAKTLMVTPTGMAITVAAAVSIMQHLL